ncbi:hypothetical protein ABZ372_27745, partial [Streptomyces sp. NPDC005921]
MPTRAFTRKPIGYLLTVAALVCASQSAFVPAQSAAAATSQFKGVNWADTRDNYNTGWVIPDGLAASDSYSQVYSVADKYIKAFRGQAVEVGVGQGVGA